MRPERIVGAFLIATQVACASTNQARAEEDTLVIQGVTVVDPTSSAPTPAQTIVISAGRIIAVGPEVTVRIPAGARVIAAQGMFAIPGLWDMHVHFMNTGPTALSLYIANVNVHNSPNLGIHERD